MGTICPSCSQETASSGERNTLVPIQISLLLLFLFWQGAGEKALWVYYKTLI